jgi:hypothetical protein
LEETGWFGLTRHKKEEILDFSSEGYSATILMK